LRGDEVIVIGGGNSAGQAAVFLAETAHKVYMLVRGKTLSETMSRYLTQRITKHPKIELHLEAELVSLEGDSRLERVTWLDRRRGRNDARDPARFRDGGCVTAQRLVAWLCRPGSAGLRSYRAGLGSSSGKRTTKVASGPAAADA
jgi:hypothetical protein